MKNKKVILSVVVIISLLSGCTSTMPQVPEVLQGENTQKGAAIGAAAGAVLGSVIGGGNKKRRIATGAVLGSVIGGVVGYNMDQQAKEIAQVLNTNVDNSPDAELNRDKDIIVTTTDRYVKITFREAMMFPTNSATLTAPAKYKIKKMIGILRNYPSTIIQVVGHTDNRGSHSYNQKLSEKRAANVASMIKSSGISNRVYRKGCSYDKPIVPNDTPENMSLNRRVEIFLYPSEEYVVNQCI